MSTLSPRSMSGGRDGEGGPNYTRNAASSPQPSPPSGEEREKKKVRR